ncbi:MAG: 2-dehydropantoate 2-reductase [Lachnospiraceae bacterium]|nr:2-dehydropantoate 2-reductase [Candidatus Equihabitans merdae]
MNELSYLIIGAGGTGGAIAAYLAKADKDVTIIARGAHLEAMQKNGLSLNRVDGTAWNIPVKACTAEECDTKADIIFVCVKGYSLESTYDIIRKASKESTIVIPILNIYGTGEKMTPELPDVQVLNGCIYIASEIEGPGKIYMSGNILRIVYGRLDGDVSDPVLLKVTEDLKEAGIEPVYSANVRRDTFQKYAYVSPMAAAGAYGDYNCGDYKRPGPGHDLFYACIREIDALANAMGIPFPVDIVETDRKITEGLADDCTSSMQKDLKKGGPNESDGLISEVVRMGKKYGVPTPSYAMIAKKVCGYDAE